MPRLSPDQKKLSGSNIRQFRDSLFAAYPGREALSAMLQFGLDESLARISIADDMFSIVRAVINTAEAEGWSLELLVAARTFNPNNPELVKFAEQFGLSPAVFQQTGEAPETQQPLTVLQQEKYIVASNGLKDVVKWRETLGTLEGQVCRVEIPKGTESDYGTGFLLGPDVLITNHHVMRLVKAGLVQPEDVILRFDYKRRSDGLTVDEGTVYRLAEEWLIDESPIGPNDFKGEEPAPDQLDYALVRVEGEPGNDPVGGPAMLDKNPDAAPRGWIKLPTVAPELPPDSSLFILQHPKGDPLKLAIDTHAIVGELFGGRRLRYRTNTDAGSSGSPCFDANWNLVALHHMGDPAFGTPTFNQGVPFPAILGLLKERGKDVEIAQ